MKLYGIKLEVWEKCVICTDEVEIEKETSNQYHLSNNSGLVFERRLRINKELLNRVINEGGRKYYWSTEPINIDEVSEMLKDDLIAELDDKIKNLEHIKNKIINHSRKL